MDLQNRYIVCDPDILHGQASLRGTRIAVHQVLAMLANGDTIDELLEDYPSLSREAVLACLEYAAALAEEEISPLTETSGKE